MANNRIILVKDALVVSAVTIFLSVFGNQYINYMVESAHGSYSGMFVGLLFPFIIPYSNGIFISGLYVGLFKKSTLEFVFLLVMNMILIFGISKFFPNLMFNDPLMVTPSLVLLEALPALSVGYISGVLARKLGNLNQEVRQSKKLTLDRRPVLIGLMIVVGYLVVSACVNLFFH